MDSLQRDLIAFVRTFRQLEQEAAEDSAASYTSSLVSRYDQGRADAYRIAANWIEKTLRDFYHTRPPYALPDTEAGPNADHPAQG
jgi:hypothetical protein